MIMEVHEVLSGLSRTEDMWETRVTALREDEIESAVTALREKKLKPGATTLRGEKPNNMSRLKEAIKEAAGMDAALGKQNFIWVIVGEPCLTLLGPEATILLVGPRILNKYRDRLPQSKGR